MIRPSRNFPGTDETAIRAADRLEPATGIDADATLPQLPHGGDPPAAPEPVRPAVQLLEPPAPPRKTAAAPAEAGEPQAPSAASRSFSARVVWLAVAVVVIGVIAGFVYGRRTSADGPGASRTAYVNAFGLNVRSGPARDQPIVTTLLRGDPVEVFDRDTRDPRWVRVRVAGVEGWVNGDYLADRLVPGVPPPAPAAPVQPRITLQYQVGGDWQNVVAVQQALRAQAGWRVGEPEQVLPTAENRPEVYGGLRFYFESDLELARAVCSQVVAELARRGMTVTMPLWPMVTGQREGRFNASPGLIEVWISPLPAPSAAPAPPGQCGR